MDFTNLQIKTRHLHQLPQMCRNQTFSSERVRGMKEMYLFCSSHVPRQCPGWWVLVCVHSLLSHSSFDRCCWCGRGCWHQYLKGQGYLSNYYYITLSKMLIFFFLYNLVGNNLHRTHIVESSCENSKNTTNNIFWKLAANWLQLSD